MDQEMKALIDYLSGISIGVGQGDKPYFYRISPLRRSRVSKDKRSPYVNHVRYGE